MERIDTSADPRVALTFSMLQDVSTQTEPSKAIAAFASRYWQIRPYAYTFSVSTRDLEEGKYKITRRMSGDVYSRADARQHLESVNPWRDWNSIPTHEGGFIGRALKNIEPQLYQHLDLSDDPVVGDEVGTMGSCMIIPVFDGGVVHNWLFLFRKDPTEFQLEDLQSAVLVTNLIGGVTKNLLNVQRIKELNDRLQSKLEEVARVQQALLPRRLPDIPGFSIATSYLTSDEAGGDYYDFFEFHDGSWGILIADVSGHGPAAATVMAMLHSILHTYPRGESSPERVLQYANDRLCASNIEGRFTTAFLGIYQPSTRTMRYTRAGHPPPRLKDGTTGEVRTLEEAATVPLGVLPELNASSHEIVLQPNDTLVLYTDGITEAFNAKREMFGVSGLDEALAACSGHPECVVDTVHGALYAFTNVRSREDDQTLIALRLDRDIS